ncbi:MAG: TraB/GumN family protein [Deltaproteobacteria bacterium]|nr:TraB/GumN family protein [Deltaproteobacteria bacterium]MBW2319037.1 TraB/GumN family protein [Deltaproteobacteria bacterium]
MNSKDTHHLTFEDKEITLIGTAHVSRESAELVTRVIEEDRPDTVCIELCESRFQALTEKNRWRNMDLYKVIKEKKAFVLLSNLMLTSLQKRIGRKLGIKPGEEMTRAIQAAEKVDAHIHLADRDIRTTLARVWHYMSLWSKLKLIVNLVFSVGQVNTIEKEDVERMKNEDVLETLLSELGQFLPGLQRILIDERDQYLAYKTRTAPGKRIVSVVGAGHVAGIKKYLHSPIDMQMLEEMPPKGRLVRFLKWGLPTCIIGLIIWGFFAAGTAVGTDMIKWWILANAVLGGLGAVMALAHPLTVLSAIAASPLTSLNPMIAAGWVAGLVEVFLRKPKVRDFESLGEDILTFKGFWKNKITRVLLVIVFTNMGSALGTFVAIPLMVRAFA